MSLSADAIELQRLLREMLNGESAGILNWHLEGGVLNRLAKKGWRHDRCELARDELERCGVVTIRSDQSFGFSFDRIVVRLDDAGDSTSGIATDSLRQQVIIKGKRIGVTPAACTLLSELISANGAWVGGKNLSASRPDKIISRMPKSVRRFIGRSRDGYRVKLELLTRQ